MTPPLYSLLKEEAGHRAAIDLLQQEAFGPGRYAKAASRLREQGPHAMDASLVAIDDEGHLLGSVWMTPIIIGTDYGYLLGPLAVQPSHKNQGIGRALMAQVMQNIAKNEADISFVALIGDQAYYAPFGFLPCDYGTVHMPWPANPKRTLIAPLRGQRPSDFNGLIRHARPAAQ